MRKVKFNFILLLLLATLFVLNFSAENTIAAESIKEESYIIPKLDALTVHGAIEISSDSDPDLAAFSGTGSSGDPYVIENFYINVTDNTGISIHDTTLYFIIRNCYVSADQYGISIYSRSVGNSIIEDCVVENNFYCGIYVHDEVSTVIENNTIFNNWGYGIYINSALGTIITDNILYNNNNIPIYVYDTDSADINFNKCWNNNRDSIKIRLSDFTATYNNTIYDGKDHRGILLDTCFDSDIYNNLCYNLTTGIDVYSSDQSNVFQNEVHDTVYYGITALGCQDSSFESNKISDVGTYGLDITDCASSSISYNVFINDGLILSAINTAEYRTYTVESNTVNGKPLGYFIDLQSATFNTPIYGQLILVNCTYTDIFDQELLNTDIGLFLWECGYTLLNGNVMNNNFIGMSVYNSHHTFAEYCSFNDNEVFGVGIFDSLNSYVIYSDINFNAEGVYCYQSQNTTINNNGVIGNNYDGISLSFCPFSRIMGNSIEENGHFGLSGVVDNGIRVDNSHHSNITNNNLLLNGLDIYEPLLATYRTYNITYNDVNGLPYGYFIDQDDFAITGPVYGQIFLVNCSVFTVADMTFIHASTGLKLVYCNNSIISNIVSSNAHYGIALLYSDYIGVEYCSLYNNFIGLYIDHGLYINVHDNDFFYNTFDGCTSQYVDNSSFVENRMVFNEYNGMQLAYSKFNVLILNLFQENVEYGLKLGASEDNIIHHNTFHDNNLLGSINGMTTGYAQGFDSKTTNLWYDTSVNEGNWWSDWSGTGSYVLDGGFILYNEDLYPLGGPTVPIVSEFVTNFIFVLPMILIPIILISYKKKNRKY